ncbi:chemotaxis protein CheC, inhibitor of MCP methylation [Singulisphaera acidiphila]|uniref:Chemotaxis protein CheC, inhibitor of MCP methylation n=1 Tax=Singulisphaera acidiphila (strain ATCC BAA-1392 / DSM 18658 / VKM B-2454 / MOB10) TaxID=886293 RepID=L0D7B1_SINAD|nr:chemotaxis protein CheC, inhibitor of MCP methylation [Singulisphaera acidiphila]AGA24755.1 chemotaxis protein CheC, inhibitor of MCP methylation [Singulisphaera acidiphila DSM 18658]
MSPSLTELQKRLLTLVFERGAGDASRALSRWLGRDVRLDVNEVELADAASLLGPADALVASCSMDLTGRLTGQLLLVFEDQAGMALADLLLRRPLGTSTSWDELERSAACETANIVGCAYLNSLAAHLPLVGPTGPETPLLPSPPTFRHEFAASLIEFALMDQAMEADRLLLVKSRFTADGAALHWSLLFVPSGESLRTLSSSLADPARR